MRLIDADALIEDLRDSLFYSDSIPFVEDAPTIDAVPVVHGEWLVLNGKLVKCFECSACHALNDYKTRHCPFCGADMRKGGSNEIN